jgi:RNA polymerase sigma-70 factor (ECF subfamily)
VSSIPGRQLNEADSSAPAGPTVRHGFAITRWSIVLRAGRADDAGAQDALERLCRAYWYPLYAHVRRRGHSAADAQDLTQGFFARLLERQTLAFADPARGRFRSFMLTALDHFVADEWNRSRAQKRGGGREPVSIDAALAEKRSDMEPVDDEAPDKAFDRRWALAVLDSVLARLEDEYRRTGRGDVFEALRPALAGPRETLPYSELARQLGQTEGAVKIAVHRLRKRYRVILEDTIADTVTSRAEAEEEMRHLFRSLGGG